MYTNMAELTSTVPPYAAYRQWSNSKIQRYPINFWGKLLLLEKKNK